MEPQDDDYSYFVKSSMTYLLDQLPDVDSFLGMLDLKTGSMIISALSVLHPTIYGCTFFMPMSYLILTIWFLLVLFFTFSVLLFYGLTNNDILLINIWIWYTLLFVTAMFLLMFLLALFFISKKEKAKVFIVFLGILWYMLTIYFILVVNSHRKILMEPVLTTKIEKPAFTESKNPPKSPEVLPPNNPESEPPQIIDTEENPDEKEADRPTDKLKAFRKASGINNRRP